MTVYESIETRKSIRDFEKRPVEPEKLQRILEAGRLAPTARCSNATRFIVVDDPDLMKKVQEACMGQALMGKAPMAVIVCSDSTRVMGCDQRASTVDCSIAMSCHCGRPWHLLDRRIYPGTPQGGTGHSRRV